FGFQVFIQLNLSHHAYGFIERFDRSIVEIGSRQRDISHGRHTKHVRISLILSHLIAAGVFRQVILLFVCRSRKGWKFLVKTCYKRKRWSRKVWSLVARRASHSLKCFKSSLGRGGKRLLF